MATGKGHLFLEDILTWRSLGKSFHPVCKDEEADGNLILSLPLFRLMRSQESATTRPPARRAKLLFSRLRNLWKLVVQHSQGGLYVLFVHTVPDVLSGRFGRLQPAKGGILRGRELQIIDNHKAGDYDSR